MKSYKISWSWIHMWHFMIYEFIYEFMYMKNFVKSFLKMLKSFLALCTRVPGGFSVFLSECVISAQTRSRVGTCWPRRVPVTRKTWKYRHTQECICTCCTGQHDTAYTPSTVKHVLELQEVTLECPIPIIPSGLEESTSIKISESESLFKFAVDLSPVLTLSTTTRRGLESRSWRCTPLLSWTSLAKCSGAPLSLTQATWLSSGPVHSLYGNCLLHAKLCDLKHNSTFLGCGAHLQQVWSEI